MFLVPSRLSISFVSSVAPELGTAALGGRCRLRTFNQAVEDISEVSHSMATLVKDTWVPVQREHSSANICYCRCCSRLHESCCRCQCRFIQLLSGYIMLHWCSCSPPFLCWWRRIYTCTLLFPATNIGFSNVLSYQRLFLCRNSSIPCRKLSELGFSAQTSGSMLKLSLK